MVTSLYIKPAQAELERQREEEKRKMEERSDQLNASQKEALLEKFKLDQVTFLAFRIGLILTMLCRHFDSLFLASSVEAKQVHSITLGPVPWFRYKAEAGGRFRYRRIPP